MTRRLAPIPIAVFAAVLVACSPAPDSPGTDADPAANEEVPSALGDGHGAIPGAEEVAEPQLHLLTVDPDGEIHHLDLLDESVATLGTVDGVEALTTEGRYAYAVRPEAGAVTVVDSGVWTWSHIDHFHYYRAEPSILGDVTGAGGPATVSANDAGAGIFFPDSGEAVVLAAGTLGEGSLDERFRITGAPHDGLVVPIGNRALVTEPDADGAAGRILALDELGEPLGATVDCADARGTITTIVGTVIGCRDGAVLATATGDGVEFEHIPYPTEDAPRADEFRARKDRPTVAAVAGDSGDSGDSGNSSIWLLDTRNREWTLIDVGEPILQATAVANADDHLLALTAEGRVLVLSGETGELLAATDQLVAESVADPERRPGLELTADQQRAYLNGPAEKKLFEIDFADDARIARVFDTDAEPKFVVETGR
ncbi:hypothetical protein [Hoyosella subflava]|uniref:ABC transporter n=1 Tax=Hoyosella subflava (strain DSM 45089 / JCM 17490 / NBRC 109087 / DQS3-9A1) TaxID=443218 RepID=F6ER95_HOYSD|nr:hypothetical protein [Hoyosella subflava]AEF41973.1 hypothetical protein AS9A_3535 [Hoyosella subflava DQS3-9A1]